MLYFTIVFLCVAGLFLALLEDRFRMWTTLLMAAAGYGLSLVLSFLLRRLVRSPELAGLLSCGAGCLVFFLLSLFFFRNNPLQKLFTALLSFGAFTYLQSFIPLFLGVLPFSPAGAMGGFLSVLITLLFYLLLGLCLYRPFQHFSDRGPSGFLLGMCVLLVVLAAFSLGKLDFLFRTNIPAARLLVSTLGYIALVFAFRSLYQAGRFREKSAYEAARAKALSLKAAGFEDTLAAVQEARSAQKNGNYALETVLVMLADGYAEKVPAYIEIAKANAAEKPLAVRYHEDPYLDAMIAAKAAFAQRNGIAFSCNVVTDGTPLAPAEIYVMVSEMLTRACEDAAACDGPKKVRFTAFPAERTLTLEALFSCQQPKEEKFSLKGKRLSEVLSWLLDEHTPEENELRGLTHTEELVTRYSGKLSLSGAPGEAILQVALHF